MTASSRAQQPVAPFPARIWRNGLPDRNDRILSTA